MNFAPNVVNPGTAYRQPDLPVVQLTYLPLIEKFVQEVRQLKLGEYTVFNCEFKAFEVQSFQGLTFVSFRPNRLHEHLLIKCTQDCAVGQGLLVQEGHVEDGEFGRPRLSPVEHHN